MFLRMGIQIERDKQKDSNNKNETQKNNVNGKTDVKNENNDVVIDVNDKMEEIDINKDDKEKSDKIDENNVSEMKMEEKENNHSNGGKESEKKTNDPIEIDFDDMSYKFEPRNRIPHATAAVATIILEKEEEKLPCHQCKIAKLKV
jgi:hypothetical protein